MSAAPGHERSAGGGGTSWLRVLLEAAVVALLVTTFGATTVGVSGSSMEPSLEHGERALVPRYETWLHRLGVGSWRRGQVVFFPDPTQRGWRRPLLIKRLVGLPGDVVQLRDGVLYRNGRAVDEPYASAVRARETSAPLRVPEGRVYVLGDNRAPLASEDSRRFGPVPLASIGGRATWVFWPLLERRDGGWRFNLHPL